MRMRIHSSIVLGIALAVALLPGMAFASTDELQPTTLMGEGENSAANVVPQRYGATLERGETTLPGNLFGAASASAATAMQKAQAAVRDAAVGKTVATVDNALADDAAAALEAQKANKLLSYEPADIAEIGTQEESGHTICCPSYACAYADAVLDGTVHDHGYYSCSCCTWTDWGGGGSFDRCVGSDEQLLREAYDQIAAGKPTVIHVSRNGCEHWIALIGYENVFDPDNLTLENFVALDPWDGAQINAGAGYCLYGDGCEHVSDR